MLPDEGRESEEREDARRPRKHRIAERAPGGLPDCRDHRKVSGACDRQRPELRLTNPSRGRSPDPVCFDLGSRACQLLDPLHERPLKADLSPAASIRLQRLCTGVTHPLKEIAGIVKGEFGKLLLVDAVSSLGCIPLPVDGWNCDAVATASQKGFMIPPGLAFISFSAEAWRAQKTAAMPRFYFDLESAQRYLERGQTPFTPNLTALYGLSMALDKLLLEGLEDVFDRHRRIASFTREGVKSLGLELLAWDEDYASDTVTAVKIPESMDGAKFMRLLRAEENVVLAGGQGKLSDSIFRIGHLGYVTQEDIEEVFEALKKVLPRVGFSAH